MDSEATVAQLKKIVETYRDERDWKQFHDPKSLAENLSVEAGELLEHFLWRDKAEVEQELKDSGKLEEVSDELADVLHCVLLLSIATGIDLDEALRSKQKKNAEKYPVEKAKGRATKYTKL